MAENYKLVGTTNSHTDWTAEVVLEKDDNGKPTKVVSATVPGELSAEDRKRVEDLGYSVEKVSKEEAEEARQDVGSDTAVSGPVFGDSERPNQAVSAPGVTVKSETDNRK